MKSGQYSVKMPSAVENATAGSTVAKALGHFSLAAMVYAPMRNLLTGEIIGPDRDRALGYLRFFSWTGENAVLWTAERSMAFSTDDVVADVHQWKDGAFVVSPLTPDPFWWAPLGTGVEEADVPPHAIPLIHQKPLSVAERGDLFLTLGTPVEKFAAVVEDIPAFISSHHKKASTGDVTSFTNDYDDVVDFLGEPNTTREQIRAKVEAYHKQWSTVLEEIVSPISVSNEGESHTVSYTTTWRTERNDEWRSGKNDLTLTIHHPSGKGLRIRSQEARVYDLESSKDTTVSPEPAAPPKPRGLRPDFKGKYTASSETAGPVLTGRSTSVLTIHEETWNYSHRLRLSASASVDAETRRELKGNVPDETTTIYAGTILGRSRTAIRLRIDSITLNEFKEATHVKLRQPLRSKGDVWTFVRRGNGLAPQGQDHTFRLQKAIDD